MKYTFAFVALLAAQILFAQVNQVSAIENSTLSVASTKSIEAKIDAIFNQAYPANSPGASVLIAKDNKVIYRKAFGMFIFYEKIIFPPKLFFLIKSFID